MTQCIEHNYLLFKKRYEISRFHINIKELSKTCQIVAFALINYSYLLLSAIRQKRMYVIYDDENNRKFINKNELRIYTIFYYI